MCSPHVKACIDREILATCIIYRGAVLYIHVRQPVQCCGVLCWLVALAVRTKTLLTKTEARHYSLRGYVETHGTTCTPLHVASPHFLPSYPVSTAGRFLTLSLAILLHGWCRCTVPSASIESAIYYCHDRRAVDLCTSRYVCILHVCSVSAGYPGTEPRAPENYIKIVPVGWLAPA